MTLPALHGARPHCRCLSLRFVTARCLDICCCSAVSSWLLLSCCLLCARSNMNSGTFTDLCSVHGPMVQLYVGCKTDSSFVLPCTDLQPRRCRLSRAQEATWQVLLDESVLH